MDKEEDDLSCCEYINSKGRKSHLLKLLCDCYELDEYSESLLTAHTNQENSDMQQQSLSKVLEVIGDRLCRFPFPRGARKITRDFILPALVLPLLQYGIVALFQNIMLIFFIYWGALIGVLIAWYMSYRRSRIFFFTITILECIQLWIYECYLVGLFSHPRIVSFNENLVLLTLFFGCIALVANIRASSSKHLVSGQTAASKYCKICSAHVPGRDHHCIWLDACVSQFNLLSFYALLVMSVVYLIYYALLGLSSICHPLQSNNTDFVVVPSNDCTLDSFSSRMICLSSLNAVVTAIPVVGLCVFRCSKNVFC